MTDLYKLQKSMMNWVLENDTGIAASIVETAEVSNEIRLDIYGKGYGYRLIDALSDNYPSVHTLMGDESFYAMAYSYMDKHPSQHYSLRYFGRHLESFLQNNYSETPILAEMASLEWLLRKAFDSADVTPLKLQELKQIPAEGWPNMHFKFHPSVSRVAYAWNAPTLWAAIDKEFDPIPPEKLVKPIEWLIWRKELTNYYRSLEADEAWALSAAMESETFERVCGGVSEFLNEEQAPTRAAGFIAQWIDEGVLIGVTL